MSITAHAELIQRLEPEALRNPESYQRRVIGLAMAGNFYVLLCFLVLIGLAAAAALSVVFLKLLGLKLLLLFGGALWLMLRALWVSVPEPRGLRIRQREAPMLFDMIEDLRARLGAPAFHHVLLSNEFNASVIQVPRFGLFGGTRNYLTIGLPLLKGTTEAQTRAVLAHEFGHLARNHAKVGNWVYRQRLRWSRLGYAFEAQGQSGGLLFTPFLKRFLPYFNAYSFPLARANEFEADATSAALTDPESAAEALTAVHAVGHFLDAHYWPEIYQRADIMPNPDAAPLQNMPEGLRQINNDQWQQWIHAALAEASSLADTHPGLRDRLEALNQPPRLNLPNDQNRADRLLGDFNLTMTHEYDQDWLREITPAWQNRFADAEQHRSRLEALDLQAGAGQLDPEIALEHAILTETIGNNNAAAFEMLEALVSVQPSHALAQYHLGIRLLATDAPRAEALLSNAMELDDELTISVAERLSDFHRRNGDGNSALKWQRTLEARCELEDKAARERQLIQSSDKFDRHGLEPALIAEIRAQLTECKPVYKAYLVRKRLRVLSHKPQYVLALRVTPFYRLHNTEKADKAVRTVLEKVLALPQGTLVFCADGDNSAFASRFRWMRGSRIY